MPKWRIIAKDPSIKANIEIKGDEDLTFEQARKIEIMLIDCIDHNLVPLYQQYPTSKNEPYSLIRKINELNEEFIRKEHL